jgi:hypothetical protein
MYRDQGHFKYASVYVEDNDDGFAGFELNRTENGETKRAASVIYWDATGQFYVETFDTDLPLDILEELIAETRSRVKTE